MQRIAALGSGAILVPETSEEIGELTLFLNDIGVCDQIATGRSGALVGAVNVSQKLSWEADGAVSVSPAGKNGRVNPTWFWVVESDGQRFAYHDKVRDFSVATVWGGNI